MLICIGNYNDDDDCMLTRGPGPPGVPGVPAGPASPCNIYSKIIFFQIINVYLMPEDFKYMKQSISVESWQLTQLMFGCLMTR